MNSGSAEALKITNFTTDNANRIIQLLKVEYSGVHLPQVAGSALKLTMVASHWHLVL